MDLNRRLKAGLHGFKSAFAPARYEAAGIQVRCPHCQGETFRDRPALLLDWRWGLGKDCTALVCENCGLIQWFAKIPDRI